MSEQSISQFLKQQAAMLDEEHGATRRITHEKTDKIENQEMVRRLEFNRGAERAKLEAIVGNRLSIALSKDIERANTAASRMEAAIQKYLEEVAALNRTTAESTVTGELGNGYEKFKEELVDKVARLNEVIAKQQSERDEKAQRQAELQAKIREKANEKRVLLESMKSDQDGDGDIERLQQLKLEINDLTQQFNQIDPAVSSQDNEISTILSDENVRKFVYPGSDRDKPHYEIRGALGSEYQYDRSLRDAFAGMQIIDRNMLTGQNQAVDRLAKSLAGQWAKSDIHLLRGDANVLKKLQDMNVLTDDSHRQLLSDAQDAVVRIRNIKQQFEDLQISNQTGIELNFPAAATSADLSGSPELSRDLTRLVELTKPIDAAKLAAEVTARIEGTEDRPGMVERRYTAVDRVIETANARIVLISERKEALVQRIDQLNTDIVAINAENTALRAQTEQYENDLAEIRRQLQELMDGDLSVNGAENYLRSSELTRRIKELESTIQAKNETISANVKKNAVDKRQVTELSKRVAEAEDLITRIESARDNVVDSSTGIVNQAQEIRQVRADNEKAQQLIQEINGLVHDTKNFRAQFEATKAFITANLNVINGLSPEAKKMVMDKLYLRVVRDGLALTIDSVNQQSDLWASNFKPDQVADLLDKFNVDVGQLELADLSELSGLSDEFTRNLAKMGGIYDSISPAYLDQYLQVLAIVAGWAEGGSVETFDRGADTTDVLKENVSRLKKVLVLRDLIADNKDAIETRRAELEAEDYDALMREVYEKEENKRRLEETSRAEKEANELKLEIYRLLKAIDPGKTEELSKIKALLAKWDGLDSRLTRLIAVNDSELVKDVDYSRERARLLESQQRNLVVAELIAKHKAGLTKEKQVEGVKALKRVDPQLLNALMPAVEQVDVTNVSSNVENALDKMLPDRTSPEGKKYAHPDNQRELERILLDESITLTRAEKDSLSIYEEDGDVQNMIDNPFTERLSGQRRRKYDSDREKLKEMLMQRALLNAIQ